ncbi:MAG: cysteine--tRNA ligase [Xanthobacteraceae bacterium]
MELKLYDTLTREKRVFRPLDPANVRMYVCGPTVYDFAHIGNARPVIVFDVLFRLLRHLAEQGVWDDGKGETKVTYVRNITDVDDKINARAAEEYRDLPLNEAIRKLTTATEEQFRQDVDALGCLRPTVEPHATSHIREMIQLIEELIACRHAYVRHGHVFYDVSSKKDYGKLSRQSLKDMIAGARVEVSPFKEGPMDFVLWKPSTDDLPGWPSPWGRGRPGWHIECSAMSNAYLGQTFDIHGGGIDLVFPHHENEIAQSEGAHRGRPLANFWLHNNLLELGSKKMSKSEGNIIKIRDLLEVYAGDVVRFVILAGQYRQPIDWTQDGLESARQELFEWSELVADYFDPRENLSDYADPDSALLEALSDDLNTSVGLAHLRETFLLARQQKIPIEKFVGNAVWLGFRHLNHPGYFHRGFDAHLYVSGPQIGERQVRSIVGFRAASANGLFQTSERLSRQLDESGFKVTLNDAGVLWVGNKTSAEMAESSRLSRAHYSSLKKEVPPTKIDRDQVEELVRARTEARRSRNFAESDRIRDILVKMGVVLKDTKDGTTWEIAP